MQLILSYRSSIASEDDFKACEGDIDRYLLMLLLPPVLKRAFYYNLHTTATFALPTQ
jgi:hypothetical protein